MKVVLVVVTVVVLALVLGLRMASDAGASGAGLVLVAVVVLGTVCSGSDGVSSMHWCSTSGENMVKHNKGRACCMGSLLIVTG